MLILARTHEHLAGRRFRRVPFPFLPEAILAFLPPVDSWAWRTEADAVRWTGLLHDSGFGTQLQMKSAPAGRRLLGLPHWFAHAILVLDGVMVEGEREYPPGAWIHVPPGQGRGLRAGDGGCWCLVRTEVVRDWDGLPMPWTAFLHVLVGRSRTSG